MYAKLLSTVLITAGLAACGGGGGSDGAPTPPPSTVTPPPTTTPPPEETNGPTLVGCTSDLPTESFVLSPTSSETDLYYSAIGAQAQWMNGQTLEQVDYSVTYDDVEPYEVIPDPRGQGNVTAYSIASGMCASGDCEADGRQTDYYRSESDFTIKDRIGDERWYAMSFYIDSEKFESPIQPIEGSAAGSGGETYIAQFLNYNELTDEYAAGTWLRVSNNSSRRLTIRNNGSETEDITLFNQSTSYFDRWIHIVFHIKYGYQNSATNSGFLKVYVNGSCRAARNLDTLFTQDGWNVGYFKWGIYRPGPADLDKAFLDGISDDRIDQTILIDNVRQGYSYEDIAF